MKTPPFSYYFLYFLIIFGAMGGMIFCFGAWYDNEESKANYPSNPTGITLHFERAEVTTQPRAPFIIEAALRQHDMDQARSEAKLEPLLAIKKNHAGHKLKISTSPDTILPANLTTPDPDSSDKEYVPHITVKKHGD